MADIILSRVTEKSQSDGTEKLLIEYQDDIYRMPLSEIVNNSGSSESVLIDDTLTLSGYAADAAAAGNRISTVEDLISDGLAYVGDGVNDATAPINADTLGGKDISYFAQKSDIKPKAGFIYPLATPNVPDGFLLCDGKAYSRTEYVELFAAIGTYYGEGDGSTTFNVPNLQTRVPVGAGGNYVLGDVGGEETNTHKHWQTIGYDSQGLYAITGMGRTDSQVFVDARGSIGVGNYTEANTRVDATFPETINNMQPYTVINYIISTGKDNTVYVRDIITGAQAMPLEVQYGGTGALNADDARKNLGVKDYKQNLLDNSDFTNPVNQRGATSYNGTYGIDRWRTWNSDTMINWNANNGVGVECSGYMFQYFERGKISGIHTLAAKKADGTLLVYSSDLSSYTVSDNGLGLGDDGNAIVVALPTGTYVWAALYEGEYTAETLPPYVPKGYTAERLECRRYYRKYNKWNDISSGYVTYNGGIYIPIPCDILMRTTPTAVGNKFQVRCNGNCIDITATPTVTHYGNVIELFFQNGTVETSNGNHPCYICVGDSTFELNADL